MQVLLDVAAQVQGSGQALEHLARVVSAVRQDDARDDLAALLGMLSLASGGPQNAAAPMDNECSTSTDLPAALSSTATAPPSGPAPHDRAATGEGEVMQCPYCKGLVAVARMDAHLSTWCQALHG